MRLVKYQMKKETLAWYLTSTKPTIKNLKLVKGNIICFYVFKFLELKWNLPAQMVAKSCLKN